MAGSGVLLAAIAGLPEWIPWLYVFWTPTFAVLDMITTRRLAQLDAAVSGDPAKHEFNLVLKRMMRRLGVDRAVMYYYPPGTLLVLFIPFVLGWVFASVAQQIMPILPFFPWIFFFERLTQVVLMPAMALRVLNNLMLGNMLTNELAALRSTATPA